MAVNHPLPCGLAATVSVLAKVRFGPLALLGPWGKARLCKWRFLRIAGGVFEAVTEYQIFFARSAGQCSWTLAAHFRRTFHMLLAPGLREIR